MAVTFLTRLIERGGKTVGARPFGAELFAVHESFSPPLQVAKPQNVLYVAFCLPALSTRVLHLKSRLLYY